MAFAPRRSFECPFDTISVPFCLVLTPGAPDKWREGWPVEDDSMYKMRVVQKKFRRNI